MAFRISNGKGAASGKTEPMGIPISKAWVQGVALVMIFGFFVMGILALRTYSDSMPQPEKVVAENGEVVFTGADITAGQQTFLRRGCYPSRWMTVGASGVDDVVFVS